MIDEIDIDMLDSDGPIALIDADSLMYYEMGKDTLEEAIKGIDSRILQILDKCNTARYAGFLTLGKCFRYRIAKTKPYKHNRKGGNKPIIFYALKEYLQQKWKFTAVKGLEADDLVSIYKRSINSVVCSPDKDVLYQVVGSHYNYGKAEFVRTNEETADKFLLMQMLMGDSTDGIIGIPKVGPKTAEKWVQERADLTMVLEKYQEKFGLAEGINRFVETFNLVYLLRTPLEASQILGHDLEPLVYHNVQQLIPMIDASEM